MTICIYEDHDWRDSELTLGLVGNLYKWIYPKVCIKCHHFKKADGTIE